MKKKPTSDSAFFTLRGLIGFAFCLTGIFVALVGFGQIRRAPTQTGSISAPPASPYRYHAGVTTCVQPPPNMVGWWAGDGNANDLTGNHNNGSISGGVTFVPGEVAQAFSFDGSSGFVSVPDSPSLDITDAITIDAWINPATPGNSLGLVFVMLKGDGCCGDTQSYGFLWGTESMLQSIILRLGNATTNVEVRSNAVIPLNEFTHVAGTYDGTTMRLYVNGVLDSSATTTLGPLQITSTPLIIGSSQRNGVEQTFFQGLVDEVEIFNRALSADEILAIYNAGSSGKCKPQVRATPTPRPRLTPAPRPTS